MGGIEKVCRVVAKALHDTVEETGGELEVYSMYDKTDDVDNRYISQNRFRGYAGKRAAFVAAAVARGRKSDVVILSHVNLLLAGYLIKLVSPKTKLILFAHGIELWDRLGGLKAMMLKKVDLFLPVSRFTGQKLETVHGISAAKIRVLNNCLDPFLERKNEPGKEKAFRAKYGFRDNDFVLLTLSRLKFSEQYKGYDKVIKALSSMKDSRTTIKYLVVGKYDAEEKSRLDRIIADHNMQNRVVFTGFVADEDLAAHFNLADCYIMPSTGEGFGVVFIEALFFGKPVIAGNVDGSVDALANGKFGMLVNPENREEIINAIRAILDNPNSHRPESRSLLEKFGFPTYRNQWRQLLYGNKEIGQDSETTDSLQQILLSTPTAEHAK